MRRAERLLLLAGLVAVLALPAAAQVTRPDEIVYPPLPEFAIPQPERFELPNGLVVMLLEDHELPLVEVRALVRTGARWEPADHIGLARLTGSVLRSGGTTRLSSTALDDLLEDKAARLETAIDLSQGNAVMSCLADDLPEMLAIFADVLRRPAFEEEQLAVAKNLITAEIARQNDDPNGILGREFRELIYGDGSSYVRTSTYATLAAIGRDDLVAWHGRYFHPDRIFLGLAGDFDKAAVRRLVEQLFGDWPQGPAVSEPETTYRETPRPGVFYAEKNDVNQSYIRLGHLGIRRDDPDYFAVEVMNQVLGGSFGARLFSNVRSQKGLAYSVFGIVSSQWDHPGLFFLTMSTKTETTAAGLAALLEEAHKIRQSEPPSDAEVEFAKTALLNSFVFNFESTSQVLEQQLIYAYYGYPSDWQERYRRGIEATTTADVRAAAVEHVQPEHFTIVVVGPRAGTDRPLGEFGQVTELDLTIPEPPAPAPAAQTAP